MSKVLLTDVDGVLLDWFSAFKQYVEYKGITHAPEHPTDWSLHTWLGITPEATDDLIENFNRSEFFAHLPAIDGAVSAIWHFYNTGWKIIAITACSSNPSAVDFRRRNLGAVFDGEDIFDEIHCVSLGQSKAPLLKEYKRKYGSCWWIEDRLENAWQGDEAGHKAIVFTRHHNIKLDVGDLMRCNGWSDVLGLISRHTAIDDMCTTMEGVVADWPDDDCERASWLIELARDHCKL